MGVIGKLLNVLGFTERVAQSISFETQLEAFQELGFTLNPGIEISDFDWWEGIQEFENEPYELLYITFGQTIEKEPWTPLTNRCWDLDTEAIEDSGDYIEILKNLARISRGEIEFENLEDFIDIENEQARVSLTIKGVKYNWNLMVNDDWVDERLFTRVVELTDKLETKGQYTYFNTVGQSVVIGFETPEQRDEIIKVTGLKIEWLT